MISKYYFEKRVEQVKLLKNIDEIPSMFKIDDPKYKNFMIYYDYCILNLGDEYEKYVCCKMSL